MSDSNLYNIKVIYAGNGMTVSGWLNLERPFSRDEVCTLLEEINCTVNDTERVCMFEDLPSKKNDMLPAVIILNRRMLRTGILTYIPIPVPVPVPV